MGKAPCTELNLCCIFRKRLQSMSCKHILFMTNPYSPGLESGSLHLIKSAFRYPRVTKKGNNTTDCFISTPELRHPKERARPFQVAPGSLCTSSNTIAQNIRGIFLSTKFRVYHVDCFPAARSLCLER